MTMPIERRWAVNNTRQFLMDLMDPKKTPRVPSEVRKEAYRCLRHYPGEYYMDKAAVESPEVFGNQAIAEHAKPVDSEETRRQMITPDTTYKIEAANKKCLRVSDCYENDNGDEVWLVKIYRNGAFFITPQDWDECDTLQAALEGENIQIDEFSEWDIDSMYDICSEDSVGDTEKMYEALDTDDWDDEEDWLENNDFNHFTTFYELQDGIILSDDTGEK